LLLFSKHWLEGSKGKEIDESWCSSNKSKDIIPFMVRHLTMNGRTVCPEVSKDEQGERAFCESIDPETK